MLWLLPMGGVTHLMVRRRCTADYPLRRIDRIVYEAATLDRSICAAETNRMNRKARVGSRPGQALMRGLSRWLGMDFHRTR